MQNRPTYSEDIFSFEGIANPYPHYAALRDLGGAVFIPNHGIWAIPRYSGVKCSLEDTATFISSKGIAVSDEMNDMLTGSIITRDGPAHARIRALEAVPLMPRSLDDLRDHVRTQARRSWWQSLRVLSRRFCPATAYSTNSRSNSLRCEAEDGIHYDVDLKKWCGSCTRQTWPKRICAPSATRV